MSDQPVPDTDEPTQPHPAPEPEPQPEPQPESQPAESGDAAEMAKDVVDPERGDYTAEFAGENDSTLVVRFADGSVESYTVDRVERDQQGDQRPADADDVEWITS